jgi:hypothetical protein
LSGGAHETLIRKPRGNVCHICFNQPINQPIGDW